MHDGDFSEWRLQREAENWFVASGQISKSTRKQSPIARQLPEKRGNGTFWLTSYLRNSKRDLHNWELLSRTLVVQ